MPGAGPGDGLFALADRVAVTELCDRYLLDLDEGRFTEERARRVFVPDVVLRFPPGTHRGIHGLDAFFDTFMGPWLHTHHHVSNYLVDLHGDRAELVCSLLAVHTHPGSPPPPAPGDHFYLGGRFTGSAVRTPVGWRLSQLALQVCWTVGRGVPAIAATMATRAGGR